MVTDAELAPLYREHLATLARGYDKIFAELGLDAIVLRAGTPQKKTRFDDQFWPLKVNPHFAHWLPLVEAGAALVVAPGQGKKPRLLRLAHRDFWERPAPPSHGFFLGEFDIETFDDAAALDRALPTGRVASVSEEGVDATLLARLDALRVLKNQYELVCLREANRIAALGHQAVSSAFYAGGMSELDLHLLYLGATRQDDAETPYKNIVAFDEHAATLHHISYGKRAPDGRKGRVLLVDAGATFLGYASDITRTLVDGDVGPFENLVAGVEKFQQELCVQAAIGLPYEQLHDRAHVEVARLLTGLGVTRGSLDEVVASGVTRAFFPHGLGHSLGLVCHDVGCALVRPRTENPFLRNTASIAAGQVFTIEPGVYFIDELIAPLPATAIDAKIVRELATFGGVRIEDDIHVNAAGPVENLTRAVLP
jgi:Xaa-Pro dipeptidase